MMSPSIYALTITMAVSTERGIVCFLHDDLFYRIRLESEMLMHTFQHWRGHKTVNY